MKDLERRLGRLEERTQSGSGVVFIISKRPGETAEEAQARYFAKHPDERGAKVVYTMLLNPGVRKESGRGNATR
ncbi:MAG: hypothetical protein V3U93_02730 [Alphaproteobacteria bacterium]